MKRFVTWDRRSRVATTIVVVAPVVAATIVLTFWQLLPQFQEMRRVTTGRGVITLYALLGVLLASVFLPLLLIGRQLLASGPVSIVFLGAALAVTRWFNSGEDGLLILGLLFCSSMLLALSVAWTVVHLMRPLHP